MIVHKHRTPAFEVNRYIDNSTHRDIPVLINTSSSPSYHVENVGLRLIIEEIRRGEQGSVPLDRVGYRALSISRILI